MAGRKGDGKAVGAKRCSVCGFRLPLADSDMCAYCAAVEGSAKCAMCGRKFPKADVGKDGLCADCAETAYA